MICIRTVIYYHITINFFFNLLFVRRLSYKSEIMSIFKNVKEIDKYKGKTVVLNSIRTDKATAVKIDELVKVCSSKKGVKVSKNQVLTGIVTSFIADIETTASTNEDEATQKLLAILN